jgi:hypothetical protein
VSRFSPPVPPASALCPRGTVWQTGAVAHREQSTVRATGSVKCEGSRTATICSDGMCQGACFACALCALVGVAALSRRNTVREDRRCNWTDRIGCSCSLLLAWCTSFSCSSRFPFPFPSSSSPCLPPARNVLPAASLQTPPQPQAAGSLASPPRDECSPGGAVAPRRDRIRNSTTISVQQRRQQSRPHLLLSSRDYIAMRSNPYWASLRCANWGRFAQSPRNGGQPC